MPQLRARSYTDRIAHNVTVPTCREPVQPRHSIARIVKHVKPGALFWFISTGDVTKGMPSWSGLPKRRGEHTLVGAR